MLNRNVYSIALFLLISGVVRAQWSAAHLSEARERPYPVVSGSKALFVLGAPSNTGAGNKVDIFDAQTGVWQVHELPFTSESTNPNPPFAEKDGKLYLADVENFSDTIQVYDSEANSWSILTISEPRALLSVGVAGDYIVFAGGATPDGNASATVDLYNTKTGAWQVLELSEPRAYLSITGLGNKIFLAGGLTPTKSSDRIDIFDTPSFSRSTKSMMRPRFLIEAVAVGDKVLMAGGGEFDFVEYNEVDLYDIESDSWSMHTLTQYDFTGLVKGLTVGHRVYFQGGVGANVLDIYDADSDTWTTEPIPTQHSLGAYTRFGSKLYLAGGVNDAKGVVEIFDCASGVWDTLGFLSLPRYWVSAAAVGNKLLLAGGYGNGYSDLVNIYTGISSGIAEPASYPLAQPWPNPAHDQVHVVLPPGARTLRLSDLQGRLQMTQTLQSAAEIRLDLNTLQPGLYLIAIEGPGGIYRGKILKEH